MRDLIKLISKLFLVGLVSVFISLAALGVLIDIFTSQTFVQGIGYVGIAMLSILLFIFIGAIIVAICAKLKIEEVIINV